MLVCPAQGQRCPALPQLRLQVPVLHGGGSPIPFEQGCIPQDLFWQFCVGQGVALRGCRCGGMVVPPLELGLSQTGAVPQPSWEQGKEMVQPCMRGDVCKGENIPLAQKIAAESGLK